MRRCYRIIPAWEVIAVFGVFPLIKAILRALRATTDGRYGELFGYDAEDGELVLGSDPARVRG